MLKSKRFFLFFFVISLTCGPMVFSQAAEDQQEKLKTHLFEALEKGNGTIARKILEENPKLVTAQRRGGWTPLHMCAMIPELTEYLIAKGADVHAQSGGGWTPLHSHAYYGTPDGIKVLLKHGGKVNQKNAFGMTPIINAVRWNKYENLRILAENGAELNVTDSLGRSPLINASISGFSKMVSILIERGADISIADKPTRRTALHFAGIYGHLDIVKLLVPQGTDINNIDSDGNSPLHYANRYGHKKVAEFLKSSGAKGKIDRSRFGFSPILKKKIPKGEAVIWFLGRIGYAVKTRNHLLIFSYYTEGNLPTEMFLANGHINLEEIKDQNIVVFAGSDRYHHHNPKRYKKWQGKLENIRFVYSFEDKVGTRNPHYLEDVEGPEYIYMPGGNKKELDGIKVESFNISNRGTGFLVEADGLVICHTGDLFVFGESQMGKYKETVQYLKNTENKIDILFQMGVFPYGKIIPANVQALDYSLGILKPQHLYLTGAQHCEYLLSEVKGSLKSHQIHTKIHAPKHRGDMFKLKK